MNMFHRSGEEKKLQEKKAIEKLIVELRSARIDFGRNSNQFLRTPSFDQMKNLIGKVFSDS